MIRGWTSSLQWYQHTTLLLVSSYWLCVYARSTTFSLVCRMPRVGLKRSEAVCSPVLRAPLPPSPCRQRLKDKFKRQQLSLKSCIMSGMTYLIVTWVDKIHSVPRDAIHKLSACLLCHVHEGNGLIIYELCYISCLRSPPFQYHMWS
jgi:hypothetical protein